MVVPRLENQIHLLEQQEMPFQVLGWLDLILGVAYLVWRQFLGMNYLYDHQNHSASLGVTLTGLMDSAILRKGFDSKVGAVSCFH